MKHKWTQIKFWKEKQTLMAAVLSLATYLYNSVLTSSSSGLFSGVENHGPVVFVSTGGLRGVYEKSREGKKFASFYGVPFAKPPVHELRFEVCRTW